MDVLLSIKPQFAERIFDGSKKFEYRKIIFNRPEIHKVIVYASNPIKRIVGEFGISGIIKDTPESLWDRTYGYAGVNRDFFFQYFTGRDYAYAICVGCAVKYKVPLNPRDILFDFVAPQSFMYVDGRHIVMHPICQAETN